MIASAILTVICVVAMYIPRNRARSHVRQMINWANVLVILILGVPLALYFEGGSFTAAPIMLFFVITSAAIWASEASEVGFNAQMGNKLTI